MIWGGAGEIKEMSWFDFYLKTVTQATMLKDYTKQKCRETG